MAIVVHFYCTQIVHIHGFWQYFNVCTIIGDGKTASVLKFELATCIPPEEIVISHKKIIGMVKYITNKILTDNTLSNSD